MEACGVRAKQLFDNSSGLLHILCTYSKPCQLCWLMQNSLSFLEKPYLKSSVWVTGNDAVIQGNQWEGLRQAHRQHYIILS